MQRQDNAVNVPNAWSSIMWFNAAVQMVSSEIHCRAVHFHYNAAIHFANVMNPDNIAPKVVQSIRNVLADKFVQMENAEPDVTQEPALKVNYVKMELALLVAEIIWIVRVTGHV